MKPLLKSAPPILIIVLSCLFLPVLAFAPPADGVVAAVFPPYWSTDQVMAAAASAGRIVRPGGVGFVLVVALDKDGARRLSQAGALLQLDPKLIGCGSADETAKKTASKPGA